MSEHFKLFDQYTIHQIKLANQSKQVRNTFKSSRLRKRNLTEHSKQLIKNNEKNHYNSQLFINQSTNPKPLKNQSISVQQSTMLEQKSAKLQSINMNNIKLSYQSVDNNDKVTLTNRKPLLFMKPYLRYRNLSSNINEKRQQSYKQITSPRIQLGLENCYGGNNFIEYFTEFKKTPVKAKQQDKKIKPKQNRTSFNIIRTKLQQYYKS